jgi:hypothetical protein
MEHGAAGCVEEEDTKRRLLPYEGIWPHVNLLEQMIMDLEEERRRRAAQGDGRSCVDMAKKGLSNKALNPLSILHPD